MIQTQKVQKEKGDFDRNNPVIHDPNTQKVQENAILHKIIEITNQLNA